MLGQSYSQGDFFLFLNREESLAVQVRVMLFGVEGSHFIELFASAGRSEVGTLCSSVTE